MSENLMAVGRLLGVSDQSVNELPDEIQEKMKKIIETIAVRNDEDKRELYNALDRLWQEGSVLNELKAVSAATDIPYVTLSNLDFDTQKEIVFEFLKDSSQTKVFYTLTNSALAVIELSKVGKLISVPLKDLRELPRRIQEEMCGAYAMEYDKDSTNAELISTLREMMDPRVRLHIPAVITVSAEITGTMLFSIRSAARKQRKHSTSAVCRLSERSQIPKCVSPMTMIITILLMKSQKSQCRVVMR